MCWIFINLLLIPTFISLWQKIVYVILVFYNLLSLSRLLIGEIICVCIIIIILWFFYLISYFQRLHFFFLISLIPSHWRKCFFFGLKLCILFTFFLLFTFLVTFSLFFFFFSASFWENSPVWYICLLQLVDSYRVSHLLPRMESPRSDRPTALPASLLPLPQATLSSSFICIFLLLLKWEHWEKAVPVDL